MNSDLVVSFLLFLLYCTFASKEAREQMKEGRKAKGRGRRNSKKKISSQSSHLLLQLEV